MIGSKKHAYVSPDSINEMKKAVTITLLFLFPTAEMKCGKMFSRNVLVEYTDLAKTKALISFGVTAKLTCVFVFVYAKCGFSHDAAHI